MTDYKVLLPDGSLAADDRLMNAAPGQAGLLRTAYARPLRVGSESKGLYRFSDFLPMWDELAGSACPVTYQSKGLAEKLGLKKLLICFNGWWPERGARMKTGSFKETEAYSVLSRFPKDRELTLVVASAGNTARAFLHCASENGISLCVVCPESRLQAAWPGKKLKDCVRLIGVPGDYADSIAYADGLCAREGYVAEGGAKNIARRDGMGTTVLSAFAAEGDLPRHYIQAVGSGTGGIAAYEAAQRLIASGQVKNTQMRLHLVQNAPFTPMADAWEKQSRDLPPLEEADAKARIAAVAAPTLTNRKPPYGLPGGVFDCLKSSQGTFSRVENGQIQRAQALFQDLEGAEICPEAGAALAGLCDLVASGAIDREESVLLNITGGGLTRALAEEQF